MLCVNQQRGVSQYIAWTSRLPSESLDKTWLQIQPNNTFLVPLAVGKSDGLPVQGSVITTISLGPAALLVLLFGLTIFSTTISHALTQEHLLSVACTSTYAHAKLLTHILFKLTRTRYKKLTDSHFLHNH